ncbi:MAG: HD domain-containing protein [Eubacteriales bacterium]|nr:HD domain-containing protein [Eubacteriales bacterium]
MKLVCVDDLVGNEILALPVVSESEVVLIHSGTVLKQEYIDKLKDLQLNKIYVEDEDIDNVNRESQPKSEGLHIYKIEETKKDTEQIVQRVLERHIYKHNKDLREIGEAADRIMSTVLSEPEVISNITEIRNISTDMYTHCINVCALSTIMALRLKMSEKQVHNVAFGAILHDIGLRYIQVPYINLNEEDMSEKEALEYKKHTIYGYSSLQDEEWISDTSKEIILFHHERIDGLGYPFCHKGDKLRLEVKLVSVCDEFDALISGIGKKKLKIYEAIEYIKVHAGDIFDANIAAKLLESVAVYPVGINVITNEGEKGVVVRQNKDALERPVIKMLVHSDGTLYSKPVEKNLMEYLTVFIVDTE